MKNLTVLRLVSFLSLAFNRTETNVMLSRRFAGIDQRNWGSRACALLVLCVITAIAAPAQFNTLHSFDGTDGSTPYGALVQGIDGNLYGTTEQGGANGAGTVFKMTTGGTVTTIYNFCSLASCTDGANPNAGLVLDTDGNFYGTTFGDDNLTCGGSGCGTVFKHADHAAQFLRAKHVPGRRQPHRSAGAGHRWQPLRDNLRIRERPGGHGLQN